MAVSEAQKKATKKYLDGLDEIRVRAKEGTKARWKAAAEVQGKSLNQFIVDTVEMAVEGHKAPVQAQADTVGYLSPGTLEAAQRASPGAVCGAGGGDAGQAGYDFLTARHQSSQWRKARKGP